MEEHDHPNQYIHLTYSDPLLLKKGDKYVLGCVVVEINDMTAEYKQYHEVIDENIDKKEAFHELLKNGPVPEFIYPPISNPIRNYV